MEQRSADLVIIGAGTAGLYALAEAKRQGLSWILIEGGVGGTTCARVGCMPSKVMLHVAEALYSTRLFEQMGLTQSAPVAVDPVRVMTYIREMRDQFVAGVTSRSTDRMDAQHLIRGQARFRDANHILVDEHIEIATKATIIATGSTPRIPEPWRALGDRILTTDTLFELERLPESLAIVGLGAIGLEIGQAMAKLGVRVAGFDQQASIGGITDPDLNDAAKSLFGNQFSLHLNQKVDVQSSPGGVRVTTAEHHEEFDYLLAAMGRQPNIAALNLAATGACLDERGLPQIDPQTMQIDDLPIFVAGDVSGDRAVMHEAQDEGLIAAFNAAQTQPCAFQRKPQLGIVFTAPNIAKVGKSYAELDLDSTLISTTAVKTNGRHRVKHATDGAIRLYADTKTGQLLGAELFCDDAEHMAHQLAWAIQTECTLESLVKLPAYHPVTEEALMVGLDALYRRLHPKTDSMALSKLCYFGGH